MKQRHKRRRFYLGAATGGLFVALAGWYIGRDLVPHWVVAYSHSSKATTFTDEVWRTA